jgi:V/A-type H+/Na+-transporting ATPase subunit D
MALALNKTSLKQQRDQLAMFRRFLPSLDLKRQQLLGALKQSRKELLAAQAEVERYADSLEDLYPLLGSSAIESLDLSSLVRVKTVRVEEENVVGAKLPVAREVVCEVAPYSTLATPFWLDALIENLRRMAELHVLVEVARIRVERLEVASRKITQRVNLFEKVLIPQAQGNIKRIQVSLSDEERAAVVRSKIAKKKERDIVRA